MSALPIVGKRRARDVPALLARWLVGGLFIYLGLSKVFHPVEFQVFLRQQLQLTHPLMSSVAAVTVPWLEVLYGLLVLSGMAREAASVLARWWLGGVFIYMGLNKALPHPEHFLRLVDEYHMVSGPFPLNTIAATLPWFEVFCGLLLLLGIAVRGSALMLIVMLVPFTAVVLKRALEIAAVGMPFCAVKFDCGCGAGEVFICHKLIENSVLLLLSAWLLAGGGRPLCLCFSLFRENVPPREQAKPLMAPAA